MRRVTRDGGFGEGCPVPWMPLATPVVQTDTHDPRFVLRSARASFTHEGVHVVSSHVHVDEVGT